MNDMKAKICLQPERALWAQHGGVCKSYEYRLPDELRDGWYKDLQGRKIAEGVERNGSLLAGAEVAKHYLSAKIQVALREVFKPEGCPIAVIHNVPLDPAVDALQKGLRLPSKSYIGEQVTLGVIRAAGLEPIAYQQDRCGELVHNVTPTPGKERQIGSEGEVPLQAHIDNAALGELSPDGMALNGLINAQHAPTMVSVVDEAMQIMEEMFPNRVSQLLSEQYRTPMAESFEFRSGTMLSNPHPLVRRGPAGYEFTTHLGKVMYEDDASRLAAQLFAAVLERVARPVLVKPGTLAFWHNRRCAHARSQFITGKRWLQRAYGVQSLQPFQALTQTGPEQRIFDARLLML